MDDAFKPGLLRRLPEPPRRVALLRASRIGDFICATPAFRALRHALPDAELTLITLPMLHEIASRLPYFEHIVDFPGFPGIAEQLFSARETVRFLQEMQAQQFDLAIQMQGTGVYSNPFLLLLGTKATAGFIRPDDSPGLLDAALPYPHGVHEIRCVLSLTEFLGAPTRGKTLDFPLRAEDRQQAAQLLAGVEPPLIGLHAGARDKTRRWLPARFVEAGCTLQQRFGGTLLLLGEPEELDNSRQMERQFRELHCRCLNLVGKTSLPILGAVIKRLNVLLTNDTGPAHIAYALGTPTVTIFGGGDPATNGPLQAGPFRPLAFPVPCRPCGYATCPIAYRCLRNISVSQVVETATQIFPDMEEFQYRSSSS